MPSSGVELLSCKVQVRKHVLVSQPSRWNQRGDRVVVQSPVPNDPDNITHVPVKRFSGEEDNSVCFIPRTDIERDTSSIYDKAHVSKVPYWVDAHGVALFNSAADGEFEYRRNDKFWICIGSNTHDYRTSVPVINLRTRESGRISIDHVCWFPKIQGPDQELWTLGGERRKLKHSGSKKFSFWSWAICQKLDGSAPTTKNVEIPDKEAKMPDRFELSSTERRVLFDKRQQCMSYKTLAIQRYPITRDRYQTALITPPSSPELNDRETMEKTGVIKTQAVLPSPAISPPNSMDWWVTPVHSMSWWNGIMEMARYRRGPYKPLRWSPIHPWKPQSTGHSRSLRHLPCFKAEWEKTDSTSVISITSARKQSPSSTSDGRLYSPEMAQLDGPGLLGATILIDPLRAEKIIDYDSFDEFDNHSSPLAISITDPGIMDGSTSIAQLYQEKKATDSFHRSERAAKASLCDIQDPGCEYSSLVPYSHYHSPPSKCGLLSHINDRPHEHCISQHNALPDRAGGCILSTLPSRNHSCCYWDDADRLDWGPALQSIYKASKLEEARKNRLKILDRSGMVKEISEQICIDMRFGASFDKAGRQLLKEDLQSSAGL